VPRLAAALAVLADLLNLISALLPAERDRLSSDTTLLIKDGGMFLNFDTIPDTVACRGSPERVGQLERR
jgi:hypothetical protein